MDFHSNELMFILRLLLILDVHDLTKDNRSITRTTSIVFLQHPLYYYNIIYVKFIGIIRRIQTTNNKNLDIRE